MKTSVPVDLPNFWFGFLPTYRETPENIKNHPNIIFRWNRSSGLFIWWELFGVGRTLISTRTANMLYYGWILLDLITTDKKLMNIFHYHFVRKTIKKIGKEKFEKEKNVSNSSKMFWHWPSRTENVLKYFLRTIKTFFI